MAEEPSLLPFKKDRFGGVIVSSLPLEFSSPSSIEAFSRQLIYSLAEWEKEGIRGVWVTTNPSEHAHLFPVLLGNSFSFHHANPTSAVLTRWLPSTPSTLPTFATHYVGAGGLVFHPTEPFTVLVISERHEKQTRLKFPGGLVDYGESILEGAKREVREETGVECEDRDVMMLNLRDRQNAPFGCSDLYIVVVLTAKSTEIIPCEVEVALAEWRDVRKVAKDPDLYPYNRALFECAIKIAEERERRREGKEKEGGMGFEMAPFPGVGNSGDIYNVWTGASLVENIDRNNKSK